MLFGGAALFEKLIVAVYATPSKDLLFTTEERVQLFQECVGDLPNVEVREFSGLVVRFARQVGPGCSLAEGFYTQTAGLG